MPSQKMRQLTLAVWNMEYFLCHFGLKDEIGFRGFFSVCGDKHPLHFQKLLLKWF